MTLIEIIYSAVIGAGILVFITVVFAFIANLFKKSPEINETEIENEQHVPQKIVLNDFSLFDIYKNTLENYPELCNYLQFKERFPVMIDRREIIRSY